VPCVRRAVARTTAGFRLTSRESSTEVFNDLISHGAANKQIHGFCRPLGSTVPAETRILGAGEIADQIRKYEADAHQTTFHTRGAGRVPTFVGCDTQISQVLRLCVVTGLMPTDQYQNWQTVSSHGDQTEFAAFSKFDSAY
jgi:hypothetical protein